MTPEKLAEIRARIEDLKCHRDGECEVADGDFHDVLAEAEDLLIAYDEEQAKVKKLREVLEWLPEQSLLAYAEARERVRQVLKETE